MSMGPFAEVEDIVDGARLRRLFSLDLLHHLIFSGHVGVVEGASDFVDPLFHLTFCRDIDINDDIAQHDSDDDSSPDSDSDPVDQRVSPVVGDTEVVDFDTTDQPRELKIGSDLSVVREMASSSCSEHTWMSSHGPMRTCRALIHLSSSIVCHFCPMLGRILIMIEYPEWLANVVPVPKKDGKVRVCVDFEILNKASPKDDFPLPHIDMLVDSTAGHSMLSFMDGFFGYSQILMAPEDMEKTSFITEWGTYCYRVMPFGLKERMGHILESSDHTLP
ncbi:Transposon Ty3-I Gag-Pol polyprotein [Vitis vinifera]|uniref:Transposon Ty3-I Gag-Pol polyprotein n=1 Tax=Vitis vinifera TaxID=29760 RepID=A0A438GVC7_VITVI|nr:Transposon Ty3-I Gag-Pol polyprotein [Vitis vinifera]